MNKKKKWNSTLTTNNLKQIRKSYLKDFARENDFYEVIYFIKGWTRTDCIMYEFDSFGDEDMKRFLFIKEELINKPIEYVTNEAYFYGLKLYVDNRVLIPRPETELIVDEIVRDAQDYETYVDLCTGSGCIPVAIAQFRKFNGIYATDISSDAIDVAKINATKYNAPINFEKHDFLDFFKLNNLKCNLLTLNPPYISPDDPNLTKLVIGNEPNIALYADDNGLKFYETLFQQIETIMDTTKKFKIVSEFGYEQKEKIKKLFIDSGLKYLIEFKRDLSHHWRYFTITN